MGFLSRLFGRGGSGAAAGSADAAGDGALLLYVRCDRCGEAIRVRVVPRTDAQPEYDEGGGAAHSYLRKEILGGRCQNLMSVELRLDARGRIVEQTAERCALIGREEYERARHAPAG